MHLSSLMCFLSVCGLCSAFFLLKEKGESIILCVKICPLYCRKTQGNNRRTDNDASSNVYVDDDYAVATTSDYDDTDVKSQRFILCKPTTSTSTTPSSTSSKTTSTTSTTTSSTTTTTTTTTSKTPFFLGSNDWPVWYGPPGPSGPPGPPGPPGHRGNKNDSPSKSILDYGSGTYYNENDTSSDYEVQNPNRILVPCYWPQGAVVKESGVARRKRDHDDVIYVDDTPTDEYFDHYPSPYYPYHYDPHPPRQYKRYKAEPPTTHEPTTTMKPMPTTTEEPTYICAVCKQKCGV